MWLVPKFPEFPGPFKVGTIDVELPLSELHSPSPSPLDENSKIVTIQYRMFYPCYQDANNEFADWLPQPQRAYVAAYCKLLKVRSKLAEYISYIPSPLSYIKIPARINAPIVQANTLSKNWPVLIFSHGLGGTRNTYSFLAGSLASYGMIVIAPEHRDGSTPVSFVRNIPSNTRDLNQTVFNDQTVDYVHLPHVTSPEVEERRNSQLKIRLWELGLIHESLLKINKGANIQGLNPSSTILYSFKAMMDIETPGKISFAGHSFGAATIAQFVKSTFYASLDSEAPSDYEPLFRPVYSASISKQINAHTPVILLDVWCLPLKAKATSWLWDRPFPSYSNKKFPGGAVLLAIESHSFYKWPHNLRTTKQLISPNPSTSSYHRDVECNESEWREPYFYYAEDSVHISPSDFSFFYPGITKKFLGCEDPQRLMTLQVGAIIQFLRNQDIDISTSSTGNKEELNNINESISVTGGGDKYILGDEKSQVKGLIRISISLSDNKPNDIGDQKNQII